MLKDNFKFRLGKMFGAEYELMRSLGFTYTAQLVNGKYKVQWSECVDMGIEAGITIYDVETAQEALTEGYWIVVE